MDIQQDVSGVHKSRHLKQTQICENVYGNTHFRGKTLGNYVIVRALRRNIIISC